MTRDGRLRMVIFIAVLVVAVVFYFLVARHWLSLDSLRTHRDAMLQFSAAHRWRTLAILTGGCVLLVAVSLPVSGVFMLLCGLLFGRWLGTLVVTVAASLGAVLAMLIARYLAQDFVRSLLRGHQRAQHLLKGFGRHQESYLLFLRVAPGFPFWITNILFGLTSVAAWRFLLLTLLGIVPDAFIYSNLGAHLASVRSRHDLFSPAGILALGLLAVLCLTPVIIHGLERRKILQPGWPLHRKEDA